jgi:hypothetical protein
VPQHKRGRLRAASSTLTPAQAQAQAEISEMRLTQRRLQERVQSAAQYGATIAQQVPFAPLLPMCVSLVNPSTCLFLHKNFCDSYLT